MKKHKNGFYSMLPHWRKDQRDQVTPPPREPISRADLSTGPAVDTWWSQSDCCPAPHCLAPISPAKPPDQPPALCATSFQETCPPLTGSRVQPFSSPFMKSQEELPILQGALFQQYGGQCKGYKCLFRISLSFQAYQLQLSFHLSDLQPQNPFQTTNGYGGSSKYQILNQYPLNTHPCPQQGGELQKQTPR